MAIKTLLVCLTSEADSESLMTAACTIARQHGAHLIGLHTIEAMTVYPGIAMHIPDSVFESFNTSQLEQSKAIKAVFDRHTKAEDFVAEWRLLKTKSASASDRIIDSARSADLVMMANEEPGKERTEQRYMQETVIRNSGRPVLIIPHTFMAETIGQSILVGWNDTREATRAAHDALALSHAGSLAHLLRIHGENDHLSHDATLTELATCFARHGIETSIGHQAWQHHGVAQIMEQQAFERGCDLIAVGAFGHSRAYDLILGAATRELLRHSKRPVLFSR